MKTSSSIATLALVLAALGSGLASAADVAPQGVTRAQVLAELTEAQRTGDIYDGHLNKKLNEIYPQLYPAKAAASTKTQAEVLSELTEAQRTGNIYDGHLNKKLNEIYPNLYPANS